MKCLTIYRIAAAAIMLGAAIAVADAPAAALGEDEVLIYMVIEHQASEPDCDGDDEVCEVIIYKVTLDDVDVTVHFATSDGTATAGEDYFGVARGTVTIPAGRTAVKAKVTIRADRVMTQDEYFYLRIFEPSVGQIMTSHRRVLIPKP